MGRAAGAALRNQALGPGDWKIERERFRGNGDMAGSAGFQVFEMVNGCLEQLFIGRHALIVARQTAGATEIM